MALYVRVSTQEQVKEGYSIGEQIERLSSYSNALNWNIYKIYQDAGLSGSNTDRPALKEMLHDIKCGHVQKVVVYKLDRLSRSQKDTLELIEDEFLKYNCDFISISENFDTATPFGRAIIGILAVFAQLEREQIKERMQIGMIARAKNGYYSGSNNDPIGYTYNNDTLTVNDFESMQVKMMFDLAESGMPVRSIVNYLNENGYKTHYGKWYVSTARNILRSKLYLGKISYSDVWYDGLHEPIITQEQFDNVQTILENRAEKWKRYNRRCGKATTYFGGYLFCKHCGSKYAINSSYRTRKDGSIYRYARYECRNRSCKNKKWREHVLTEALLDEIRKLSLDPEQLKLNINKKEDNKKEIITIELNKLDKKVSNLIDLYSDESIPRDVLQNKIASLNDNRNNLLSELNKLDENRISTEEIMDAIHTFDDVLNRGDFDEIRSLIAVLIDKVEVDNDDLYVYWNFN